MFVAVKRLGLSCLTFLSVDPAKRQLTNCRYPGDIVRGDPSNVRIWAKKGEHIAWGLRSRVEDAEQSKRFQEECAAIRVGLHGGD